MIGPAASNSPLNTNSERSTLRSSGPRPDTQASEGSEINQAARNAVKNLNKGKAVLVDVGISIYFEEPTMVVSYALHALPNELRAGALLLVN